jgi:hypothetical protein
MTGSIETSRKWVAAIVLAHAAIALVHGAAHGRLGIVPSLPSNAFIVTVIGAGPLVALGLILLADEETGGGALAATMAGALVFGVWNHFAVSGPDHVAHVGGGGWGRLFQATAVLLAAAEAAGTWAGLVLLRPMRARASRQEG